MSNTLLHSLCAIALSLAILVPATARAGGPSDDVKAKSSALYNQARALQIRGQWAEAEAAYQAAWNLRQSFDVAGNLGDCEVHIGQLREAAEHLSYALDNRPAGVSPEQIAALERLLNQARAQVGALRVAVNVTGAEIFVDGKRVDAPGSEIFVEPGTRTIEARLDGHAPARTTVNAPAGVTASVGLKLVPKTRSIVPGVVMGGVGFLALVGGVASLVVRANLHASNVALNKAISQGKNSCVVGAANYDPKCSNLERDAPTADALGRAGTGLLVGAGAAAAGSLLYFLWPESKRAPAASGFEVMPMVGAGGVGLVVGGTF